MNIMNRDSSSNKTLPEQDVFLEAQELLDKIGDIICTCPTCMTKLQTSKKAISS